MIAFFVITTVINIALGYALAVYLGNAAAAPDRHESFERGDKLTLASAAPNVPEPAASIESIIASSIASITMLEGKPKALVEQGAPQPASTEQEDSAGQVRTPEMEQDLLAGIEEFRNQLAQLKAQSLEDDIPEPAQKGG